MLKVLCVLLFITNVAFGQQSLIYNNNHLFTVQQLQSDFLYTQTLLYKIHPSLYRYIRKDSLDNYFKLAYAQLTQPLNEVQYWEVAESIISKVGSGHTFLTLSDGYFKNYYNFSHPLFPFFVNIKAEKLFLTVFFGRRETQIKSGDEILSINGVTASKLIDKFRKCFSDDGYSNAYKDYQLSRGAFNRLYCMLMPESAGFKITYLRGDKIEQENVPSENISWDKSSFLPILEPGGPVHNAKSFFVDEANNTKPILKFPEDIPGTALLKIERFIYPDFRSLHRSIFKELENKKIQNLIIDLRGNLGGYDQIAIDLLKYLIPQKFYYTRQTEELDFPSNLKDIIDVNNSCAFDNLSQINGERLVKTIQGQVFKPYNQYPLNIFLIVDGGTYSAACLFASAIKSQGKCVIIGNETGGGRSRMRRWELN